MSFVNTVDVVGDDALADSIIQGTITEFFDSYLTTVGIRAFIECDKLSHVEMLSVTRIGTYSFRECPTLTTFVLRNETTMCIADNHPFYDTPIADGTGYIYVPRALVDSYKAATNWSTYAAQFRALEDYTVDGTTTGELDPNKI